MVWFWELSASRQAGMNGPLPLPWAELQAWLTLSGEHVTREELAILRGMDAAFLTGLDEWRVWHEAVSKKSGGKGK